MSVTGESRGDAGRRRPGSAETDVAGRDGVAEHRLADGDAELDRLPAGRSPRSTVQPDERRDRSAGAGPVDTTSCDLGVRAAPRRRRRASCPTAPTTRSPNRPARSRRTARSAGSATSWSRARRRLGLGQREPVEVGQRAELRTLADDDEERLALGEVARRPTGAVRMISPSVRVLVAALVAAISTSQSKSAVCVPRLLLRRARRARAPRGSGVRNSE